MPTDTASSIETRIALVLSTAHVSQSTADWLDEQAQEPADNRALDVASGVYAFWLYVHDEYAAEYPKDLCDVFNWAKANRYDYVCLDRDGPEIDQLPRFEW